MSSRSGNFVIHLGTQYYSVQWIQDKLGLKKRKGGSSREGTIIRGYLTAHQDGVTIFKPGRDWCISAEVIDDVVSDIKDLLDL